LSFINNLNNADFAIMLVFLLAMLYGYIRGFLREFLSIFSIFFSGYLSIYFYPKISAYISQFIKMGIVNDIISLAILFFFIYSCFGILIKMLVKKINRTSLEIFDKNFGILFGFIKAMVLFSILNIFLVLAIWKETYPKWALESKSYNVINYTSNLVIKVIPSETIDDLMQIFEIENFPKFIDNKLDAENYGEPQLKNKTKQTKEGYSKNDNESLDKLFNIENND